MKLSEWIRAVESGRQHTIPLYASPSADHQATTQPVVLGFEQRRIQQSEVADKKVEWQERLLMVQSPELAKRQAQARRNRSEYLIEHNFSRLKGRQLSVRPLQVRSDERIVGLLRLLSIGLRVLCLVEHEVRERLAAQKLS